MGHEKVTEGKLTELGFGYRALYMVGIVKDIVGKGGLEWLGGLREEGYEKGIGELTGLKGVGRKVADCVLLFSMDKLATIPVDKYVVQGAQVFNLISDKEATKRVTK